MITTTLLFFISISFSAAISKAARMLEVGTKFSFRRPTADNILSILFGSYDGIDINDFAQPRFNHDSVGITETIPICNTKYDSRRFVNGETICSGAVINGWRVLRFYRQVGYGKKCYRRLQQALFDWNFECCVKNRAMGIIAAGDTRFRDEYTTRNLLATFTELRLPRPFKSVFVVNPVYVVHERRDAKQKINNCLVSSTSYATLKGHLLAGEERVSVIWRNNGDEVDVEIISCSRAAPSIAGKLIWPLVGKMQKQFFLEEMDHLAKV